MNMKEIFGYKVIENQYIDGAYLMNERGEKSIICNTIEDILIGAETCIFKKLDLLQSKFNKLLDRI